MSQAADPLDLRRWRSLWRRLGARSGADEVFAELSAGYAEPSRAYHTAIHIQDCLAQLDLSREFALRPDEVEAALWFHDAVYVPGVPDNEERSALLAQRSLTGGGAPPEVARRTAELVLETAHREVPGSPDAQLLCDIDLSILGRDTAVFDRYEREIRREYAHVPESEYRSGRAMVLARFLSRVPLYRTPFFRDRYEAPARKNLERALSRLRTRSGS